jgi:hypothetical protein
MTPDLTVGYALHYSARDVRNNENAVILLRKEAQKLSFLQASLFVMQGT